MTPEEELAVQRGRFTFESEQAETRAAAAGPSSEPETESVPEAEPEAEQDTGPAQAPAVPRRAAGG